MNPPKKIQPAPAARRLSRTRIILALTVAVLADGLQIVLLPLFAESAVDVVAMVLTMGLLGFHMLLLPTFIVEFIPVVDVLPTWTACTLAVIYFRKRAQGAVPPPSPAQPTIEV